jgi:hypothetical protein
MIFFSPFKKFLKQYFNAKKERKKASHIVVLKTRCLKLGEFSLSLLT